MAKEAAANATFSSTTIEYKVEAIKRFEKIMEELDKTDKILIGLKV